MYILVIFKAPNKPVPKWKESLSLITLKLGKKNAKSLKNGKLCTWLLLVSPKQGD
jgi:hypothetical protein